MTQEPHLSPRRNFATIHTHHLLHHLWTKAVGTAGYDKAEWIELERRLVEGKP